jgi:ketosteroid isomerase-like protein
MSGAPKASVRAFLERWHGFVADGDPARLDAVLADDVVFHAPAYIKPRRGKAETKLVLATVAQVFEDFRYHRQWVEGDDIALEFSARIGKLDLKGVDLVRVNADGRAVDFEVMVRPINALEALFKAMAERIAQAQNSR